MTRATNSHEWTRRKAKISANPRKFGLNDSIEQVFREVLFCAYRRRSRLRRPKLALNTEQVVQFLLIQTIISAKIPATTSFSNIFRHQPDTNNQRPDTSNNHRFRRLRGFFQATESAKNTEKIAQTRINAGPHCHSERSPQGGVEESI